MIATSSFLAITPPPLGKWPPNRESNADHIVVVIEASPNIQTNLA